MAEQDEEQGKGEEFDASEAAAAIADGVTERSDAVDEALSAEPATPAVEAELATPAIEAEPAAVVPPVEEPILASPEDAAAPEADEPNLQISVGNETVRISTAHPLIEDIAKQLDKARQLTTYSIASLCIALLAAIVFYVIMSVQMSNKVGEVDAMLNALAKRVIQVSRGIESFSALEDGVNQALAGQQAIQERLAEGDAALLALDQQVAQIPETRAGRIDASVTANAAAVQQDLDQISGRAATMRQQLTSLEKNLQEASLLMAPVKGIRRELTSLRENLERIDETVADLYIIERARVAKEVLGITEPATADIAAESP